MSNSNGNDASDRARLEDLDRIRPGDPGVKVLEWLTLEEIDELGLSCETWEAQKRFDRQLAEERARRAAG